MPLCFYISYKHGDIQNSRRLYTNGTNPPKNFTLAHERACKAQTVASVQQRPCFLLVGLVGSDGVCVPVALRTEQRTSCRFVFL